MGNIDKNLLNTLGLARRIANSISTWNLDWKTMMGKIFGSRTEEFGVGMLEDAPGHGACCSNAESAIGLWGMGILGWIALLISTFVPHEPS